MKHDALVARVAQPGDDGTLGLFHILFDGGESVVGVSQASKAVAVLAQVIVVAVLTLPADTADGVQADVAVNIVVNRFYEGEGWGVNKGEMSISTKNGRQNECSALR